MSTYGGIKLILYGGVGLKGWHSLCTSTRVKSQKYLSHCFIITVLGGEKYSLYIIFYGSVFSQNGGVTKDICQLWGGGGSLTIFVNYVEVGGVNDIC